MESADDLIRIKVRVTPGAKRASIGGTHDGALKVSVTEPPENGKANEAVIKLIAKQLKISKSRVSVLSGSNSRVKTIGIRGVTLEQTTASLLDNAE